MSQITENLRFEQRTKKLSTQTQNSWGLAANERILEWSEAQLHASACCQGKQRKAKKA